MSSRIVLPMRHELVKTTVEQQNVSIAPLRGPRLSAHLLENRDTTVWQGVDSQRPSRHQKAVL
jgi:hypothetical protein